MDTAMTTEQQNPRSDGPGQDDEQKERPGNTGRGAESALNRMKQLERSRASLRGGSDDGTPSPGE